MNSPPLFLSHPPYGTWTRAPPSCPFAYGWQASSVKKGSPPASPRFLASPLFLPRPPLSTFPTALCSLSCPHRSHSVLRDTHLPLTPSRTLIQSPPETRISLSWRSSTELLMMPMMHCWPSIIYITGITTLQKQLPDFYHIFLKLLFKRMP